jgi:hypothetical protein
MNLIDKMFVMLGLKKMLMVIPNILSVGKKTTLYQKQKEEQTIWTIYVLCTQRITEVKEMSSRLIPQ